MLYWFNIDICKRRIMFKSRYETQQKEFNIKLGTYI